MTTLMPISVIESARQNYNFCTIPRWAKYASVDERNQIVKYHRQSPMPYFTASLGPDDRIVIRIHATRDEAMHDYAGLGWSDARRRAMGKVPSGIAKRSDVADVLKANLRDAGWRIA